MSKLDDFLTECERPVPSMSRYASIGDGCEAKFYWEDKQLAAVPILAKMVREIQNAIDNEAVIGRALFTEIAERALKVKV
jgi:hypothetical protein